MKAASRPILRSVLAACLLTPLALQAQSSDSPAENVSSALNPNNDAARTLDTSVDRVLFRLSTPELVNAGPASSSAPAAPQKSWECDWFKSPTVFVNNLFNNNNDQRPSGLDTFQYRLQIGADFVTYADIIAGVLYTYGYEEGEADDIFGATQEYDKVSHHMTLYAGRSFGDWFLAGATMTLGWADIDSNIPAFAAQGGNDTFSYSPSVYAGVAHSWDQFGFSSVFAYQYEDISYDPGVSGASVFNTSTGTFTWKTSGTWYAADWVDVSAYYKLTQIAHTNVQIALPAGESNDHNWSTIGSKATFHPAASWEVYAGVDYDLFNRNYGENVTGLLGAGYRF
jgi:hypothetical protein